MRTPICWKCQEVLTERISIGKYAVREIVGCKLLVTSKWKAPGKERVNSCPLHGKRKNAGIVKSKSRFLKNLIKRCFGR